MKALSILLLILVGCNCSSIQKEVVPVQQLEETPAVSVPDVVIPKNDGNFQYPIIRLEAPIDNDIATFMEKALDAAAEQKVNGLIIEIDSGGGSYPAGFRISKAIEAAPFPVYCVVDGMAASMAYYILQSCDFRYMTKRSTLMIHQVLSSEKISNLSPEEIQNVANEASAFSYAIVQHEVAKMKIKAPELIKRTIGPIQWWLTWKDALKYGAVDDVVPGLYQVAKQLRDHKTIYKLPN